MELLKLSLKNIRKHLASTAFENFETWSEMSDWLDTTYDEIYLFKGNAEIE